MQWKFFNTFTGSELSTLARKEPSTTASRRPSAGAQPVIPQWGSPQSGNRLETEPVAKFQVSDADHATEIMFNPPMQVLFAIALTASTGRFILMKLFNNTLEDNPDKEPGEQQADRRRETQSRPRVHLPRDDPPPVGDPLRFDMIDDELEEPESAFGDSQDDEVDFENVDVQAILFYGHTGRRRFPILQAL